MSISRYLRRRDIFNWSSMLECTLTDGTTHYTGLLQCPGRRQQMEWSTFRGLLFLCSDHPPLSQSISMGWNRRETALRALVTYRLVANNMYIAHASWDWDWDWGESSKGKGGRGCVENREDEANVYGDIPSTATEIKAIDWLNHSDTTLCHLIHLSDSLCQYLTLPSATRARHRATSKGRKVSKRVLSAGCKKYSLWLFAVA